MRGAVLPGRAGIYGTAGMGASARRYPCKARSPSLSISTNSTPTSGQATGCPAVDLAHHGAGVYLAVGVQIELQAQFRARPGHGLPAVEAQASRGDVDHARLHALATGGPVIH